MIELIRLRNTGLISYIFPTHSFIHSPGEFSGNVVLFYSSKFGKIMDVIKSNAKYGDELIILCNEDISTGYKDLDNRENLVKYISMRLKIKVPKSVQKKMEYLKDVSVKDFDLFIKQSILSGVWKINYLEKNMSVFNMYESYSKSKEEFIKSVIECCKSIGDDQTYKALQHFAENVDNYENIKTRAKGKYKKSLRRASTQSKNMKRFTENIIHLPSGIPLELRIVLAYLE